MAPAPETRMPVVVRWMVLRDTVLYEEAPRRPTPSLPCGRSPSAPKPISLPATMLRSPSAISTPPEPYALMKLPSPAAVPPISLWCPRSTRTSHDRLVRAPPAGVAPSQFPKTLWYEVSSPMMATSLRLLAMTLPWPALAPPTWQRSESPSISTPASPWPRSVPPDASTPIQLPYTSAYAVAVR